MKKLESTISNYLEFCHNQKKLDTKTLKAYQTDLKQFSLKALDIEINDINSDILEKFIGNLHKEFKPKTVKRKIASLKAFFHYLEYKDIIKINPFNKIQIKFREPNILPKTIPLNTMELFLSTMYKQYSSSISYYKKRKTLRDIAIIELLFSTGIRISELCSLKPWDIDLCNRNILVYGKGHKERLIQIGNDNVIDILKQYETEFQKEILQCKNFFVSLPTKPLSDQSVRRMITKYSTLASINLHITPHMFRHTFATCLLEADVDIRYIQKMLGHSSINITEIYTHVAISKQKEILTNKHPRKNFHI